MKMPPQPAADEMSSALTWKQLFKEARAALKQGRRSEARRLARKVVRMAPKQEAPWLLLAATAEPQASVGYLKQALAINPRSRRARQGLRWAQKRIQLTFASNQSIEQSRATASLSALGMPALGLLTLAFLLFVWLRPPSVDRSLRALGVAFGREVNSLLATPTPALTETATASPTPAATQSPSPTTSPITIPGTPTNTPEPTNSPDDPEARGKFFPELPSGISENERWIDVNLSSQTLTAYEGAKPLRGFTVSTGVGSTPTVTGEFRVWVKVPIQAMSGPGYYLPNVPNVMYFYNDYGIHGTWWHSNFGTPMSAGCVNMTIEDSQWLYNFAEVGTIVKVHY